MIEKHEQLASGRGGWLTGHSGDQQIAHVSDEIAEQPGHILAFFGLLRNDPQLPVASR